MYNDIEETIRRSLDAYKERINRPAGDDFKNKYVTEDIRRAITRGRSLDQVADDIRSSRPGASKPVETVDRQGTARNDGGGNNLRSQQQHSQKRTVTPPDFLAQPNRNLALNNPRFWDWFGNSVIIDDSGKPLIVYHGTRADFTEFRRPSEEIGMHFGDLSQAHDFVIANGTAHDNANIMPVYLRMENPLRIDFDPMNWEADNIASIFKRLGMTDRAKAIYDLEDTLYQRRTAHRAELDAQVARGEITKKEASSRFMELAIREGHDKQVRDLAIRLLKDAGYDGVIYPNMFEGAKPGNLHYMVFAQIDLKRRLNQGIPFPPGGTGEGVIAILLG